AARADREAAAAAGQYYRDGAGQARGGSGGSGGNAVTGRGVLAQRLIGVAAVAAIVAFATAWTSLAQTTGQQTAPGQSTAVPQAAPPGQGPSTPERLPTPAPQPAPPAQSPSTGGPAGAIVEPSSFPLKLPPMVDWSFGGFF